MLKAPCAGPRQWTSSEPLLLLLYCVSASEEINSLMAQFPSCNHVGDGTSLGSGCGHDSVRLVLNPASAQQKRGRANGGLGGAEVAWGETCQSTGITGSWVGRVNVAALRSDTLLHLCDRPLPVWLRLPRGLGSREPQRSLFAFG